MSLWFDPSLPVINLGLIQMRLFEKNVLMLKILALQTQCPAQGDFFFKLLGHIQQVMRTGHCFIHC